MSFDPHFTQTTTVTYATFLGLTDVTEPFTSDTGQFTKFTASTGHTFAVGGTGVLTNASGTNRDDLIVLGSSLTIPQAAVQIDLVNRTGTLPAYSNVGVGVIKDANNFVLAAYDHVAGAIRIELKVAGSLTFHASVSRSLTPGSATIGFAMIANSICAYVNTGSGFEYVTGYNIPTATINFKTVSLTNWKCGFMCATANNQVWTLDNFKSGRFGGFGIRDICLVTDEDGDPYVTGGTVYVTATLLNGLGIGHQGVLTVNLTTYALTMTAALFNDRSSTKHNDFASHIIYYANGDRRIAITSWGSGFGVAIDIYHALLTGTEILSGTHLLSGLTKLTLPHQLTGYAVYDPNLVRDGSTWRLIYSVNPDLTFTPGTFYAAVATSSDLSSWSAAGNDSATFYEGTRWAKPSNYPTDDYHGLAGTGDRFRVFDKTGTFVRYLDASVDGGTLTQPHPQVFYNSTGTKYVLLTFNKEKPSGVTNPFTWGQMVVHEATIASEASDRNLVTGDSHTVLGDDNFAAGVENRITGDNSEVHGTGAVVTGDRTVIFNQTTTPHTLAQNNTFAVYADVIILNGSVTGTNSAAFINSIVNGIVTDGGVPVTDSDGNLIWAG